MIAPTHRHSGSPGPTRRHTGLTLIELLLSITITAIIGAATTAMLSSVTTGTSQRNDVRALVVRHKAITSRINASVGNSTMILARGTNYLVLWNHDANANAMPNISEIQRIELNTTTGQVSSFTCVFPVGWTQAQRDLVDLAYPLTSNFDTVSALLKTQSYGSSSLWASGITDLTMTTNQTDPQSSYLLNYRVTIRSGTNSDTVIGAVALRTSGILLGSGL